MPSDRRLLAYSGLVQESPQDIELQQNGCLLNLRLSSSLYFVHTGLAEGAGLRLPFDLWLFTRHRATADQSFVLLAKVNPR